MTARTLLTLIVALSATAPTATAQPVVFDPAAGPRAREGFRLLDGVWVRPAGTFTPRDLLDVALVDGRLQVAYDPSPDWRRKLRPGRRVVGERDDQPDRALWHLLVAPARSLPIGNGAIEDDATFVMLSAEDPLPPAGADPQRDFPPRLVAATVTQTEVRLRGLGRFEGGPAAIEYRANADGSTARLTVQLQGNAGADVTGDDLIALLSANPTSVRQFLRPLLLELSGNDLLRPRAGDFYRAFDAIEPTPAERSALAAVLPLLNADDPVDRDRATGARLDALGPGGVLAAMRADPARLSPEQAARIRAFVARHTLMPDADPAAARSDLLFLREAAQDADPRVREAARERLTELAN